MSWPGHAILIGRVEVRRSLRRVRAETNVLVGLGFTAIMLLAATVAVSAGAYYRGEEIVASEFGRQTLRMALASLLFGAPLFVAFRVTSDVGKIDAADGMLTTVSARAVLGGLMLAEATRFLLHLAVPVGVVAVALAAGSGEPLAAVAVIVIAALVLAFAVAVGFLVGEIVLYVSSSIRIVARNRYKVVAALLATYFGLLLAFADLATVIGTTPLGWLAEPLLLALGGDGSVRRATVALAGLLAAVPVAGYGASRAALLAWYADPADPDDGGEAGTVVSGVDAVLAPLASRPTVAVARKSLLRARRAPHSLTYAFVPAFALVGYLAQVLETGHPPEGTPIILAAYLAWGVGAAFTLNPLGDEGALLPVTVSSGISGHQFVRGRVLAAWVPGLPLATLVVVGGAVAVGMDPIVTVFALVFGVGYCAVAPPISVGVGTLFPKFDSRRMVGNREAVVPSVFAFTLYVIALTVVGVPGVASLMVAHAAGGVAGVPAAVVAAVGVGLSGFLALAASVPSYLYAVRSFDGFAVS